MVSPSLIPVEPSEPGPLVIFLCCALISAGMVATSAVLLLLTPFVLLAGFVWVLFSIGDRMCILMGRRP